MKRSGAFLLRSAAVLLISGTTLGAQTTGLPPELAPLPPAEITEMPVAPRVQSQSEGATARASLRYPIVAATGETVVRLSGEQADSTLDLFLPEGAPPREIRLSYRMSINSLPEASSLRLVVNGVPTEPIAPDAFEGFTEAVFATQALVPGRNSVKIEVNQSHRIYCGPDASFAIWLEVDLQQSGVVIPADAAMRQATNADAAALLAAQAARPEGIALRLAPGTDPGAVAALARRLAALSPGSSPAMREQTVWEPVNADSPHAARIIVEPGTSPSTQVLRGGDGALVLRIVHGLPDGADTPLPDLTPFLPVVAAAQTGRPMLEPGVPMALFDLGREDIERKGHYIKEDVMFRLPRDWLVLGPQVAEMELVYGFADGLPKGSLLLVKANGTTIQLLPMDRNGGEILPPLDIRFKAALLQPGPNSMTFEAIIPGDPPDLPCPTITAPTLRVMADTLLQVPETPSMQFSGMENVLPRLDGADLREAETGIASGLTEADLFPLAAMLDRVVPEEPQGDEGLTVLSYPELDRLRLDELGLSRRDIETLLAPAPPPPPAPTRRGAAAQQPDEPSVIAEWAKAGVAELTRLAGISNPPLSSWIQGRRAKLILVQPLSEEPDNLVLALGPTTSVADAATALANTRDMRGGPAGRVAILTEAGNWETWRPVTSYPVLLEPLTIGNLRFVLGTYASWSPLGFTIIMMALTLISVFFALVYVMTTRGHRKR